jgi:muconolactone delta-isomerase
MADEDFRVEIDLDDEEHGYSTEERLRAAGLDDEVRAQLGPGVMVTRDGSRLFLYTATEGRARAAESVVRSLVANDELSAEIRVTRWHPVEEAWKDAALPLPAMEAEIEAEYAAREAAEAAEAEREGHYDWHVVVHLPSRGEAAELAERLAVEGQVTRRWRYVSVGVVTEERAEELAERLASELPEGSDVRVEVNLSDVAHSPLQFLPF